MDPGCDNQKLHDAYLQIETISVKHQLKLKRYNVAVLKRNPSDLLVFFLQNNYSNVLLYRVFL